MVYPYTIGWLHESTRGLRFVTHTWNQCSRAFPYTLMRGLQDSLQADKVKAVLHDCSRQGACTYFPKKGHACWPWAGHVHVLQCTYVCFMKLGCNDLLQGREGIRLRSKSVA